MESDFEFTYNAYTEVLKKIEELKGSVDLSTSMAVFRTVNSIWLYEGREGITALLEDVKTWKINPEEEQYE